MKFFKLWIIVGGTGRNIGKTTLAEILVDRLSSLGRVVGIKMSNIKPDGLEFHGKHEISSDKNFLIWEETENLGNKDSMRFLKAGAKKSFFIQTGDEFLREAFQEMLHQLDGNEIVVCESNSLRNIMKPAVFLMIKGESSRNSKDYVEKFFELADCILNPMDLVQFKRLSESLVFEEGQIKLVIKQ